MAANMAPRTCAALLFPELSENLFSLKFWKRGCLFVKARPPDEGHPIDYV